MKIGVTQIILQDLQVPEIVELCTEAGYEAIELLFMEGGNLDIGLSEAEIRAVGEQFEKAGIEIVSLLAWYKDRGSFLSGNTDQREKGRRSLRRALEIANILGVKTTLLHPGGLEADVSYVETWNIFVREMKEIASEAAEKGVTIAIENVWNRFMLSPKEACDLVDEVGSPNFGVYLDTANMMAYGYPEQWIRDLGERIAMVHFKDFNRKDHRFVDLMDGDTDWAKVMAALRDVGYSGAVLHEVGGNREKQLELADRMRQIVSK